MILIVTLLAIVMMITMTVLIVMNMGVSENRGP